MSYFLSFSIGLIVGAVIIGCVAALVEEPPDIITSILGFILRPTIPLWIWSYSIRRLSGFTMRGHDGRELQMITDGNEWLALFSSERKHVGFSPLLLLPAGLVRLAVRAFAHEITVCTRDREHSQIFYGLGVAPGLIVARRRAEDLAYLKTHDRYPTFDLTAR